jgi:hypothetical protein
VNPGHIVHVNPCPTITDSGIGFGNWIRELDSGIGFGNWIRELDSELELGIGYVGFIFGRVVLGAVNYGDLGQNVRYTARYAARDKGHAN